MKQKIKSLNLRGKGLVRINRSGCFDRCSEGPMLVVYPDAVWYTFIDEADIDEIIQSHIINNITVKRLII
jgi:(2Fe-2S) ferredoxin